MNKRLIAIVIIRESPNDGQRQKAAIGETLAGGFTLWERNGATRTFIVLCHRDKEEMQQGNLPPPPPQTLTHVGCHGSIGCDVCNVVVAVEV